MDLKYYWKQLRGRSRMIGLSQAQFDLDYRAVREASDRALERI